MQLVVVYSKTLRSGFVAPNRKEAEGIASFNAKIRNLDLRDYVIQEVEIDA